MDMCALDYFSLRSLDNSDLSKYELLWPVINCATISHIPSYTLVYL